MESSSDPFDTFMRETTRKTIENGGGGPSNSNLEGNHLIQYGQILFLTGGATC